MANAFNIFLLKRFFDSIPTDYIDAASVDGASADDPVEDRAAHLAADHRRGLDLRFLVAVWKDFVWPLLVEYGYTPARRP